jgi:alpha-N-acetylglucosaminidase
MRKLQLLFLLMLFVSTINAQTYQSVMQLAQRRVPWLVQSLTFSRIPADGDNDVFELSSINGKLNIAASNSVSAAQGLGWYLKYYCNRSISHLGDNLSPQKSLPKIKGKVRIASAFKYRYALNYCTVSYSMSFYNWKDWEHEIDWMALNGVNLMLAPVGMEAVWQNTMQRLGCSDKDIKDFIPGPAFGAWWLMGNLEGWGGPVSQKLINQQALLQQKIVARMHELAIEPVMHGFYGMIPTALKNSQKISVIDQDMWGGYKRPDFLNPSDSSFEKVANIYYEEMKKLYGADLKYFGGDPFHEGGITKGVDVSFASNKIQKVMQNNFKQSTWVLQGWSGNPTPELLKGLDKKKTLVIELFGENTNNWELRKAYEETPFVWSNVSNFGEKNGIYGKLQRFANEVDRAKKSIYCAYLQGVGIIPEGINNNPVDFDLMLELGWHQEKVDVKQWINKYQQYRYGKNNPQLKKAWQLLLETGYSSPDAQQEGPSESIFVARPGVDIKSASTWGTRKRNYNTAKFKEAVKMFESASGDFKDSETYQTDRIDFVRQVLANNADEVYMSMMNSIKSKNEEAFLKSSTRFQNMLLQQDSLLSNSKYFALNKWLQQAVDFGTNDEDKKLALKNAKMQISYWGPNNYPKTYLHDYANKEWNGLLGSLYLSRWKAFTAYQLEKMKNPKVVEPNYYKMETEWADEKDMYIAKPSSSTKLDILIKRILE